MELNKEYPLVTVFIPCFKNHDDAFISIDSVFKQTYPNIELIISDDHTPDEFSRWSEIESYANENRTNGIKKMLVVRYEENSGTSVHFNKNLKYATGEYLKFVPPGDELYDSHTLEVVIEEMLQRDSRFLAGQTYVKRRSGERCFDEVKDTPMYRWQARHGKRCNLTPSNYDIDYLSSLPEEEVRKIIASQCIMSTISICFRMDLLREAGGFPTEYRLIEDVAFWPMLAIKGERFDFTHTIMMRYSLNGTSNGGEGNTEFCRDLRDILRKYYIPNECRGGIFNKYIKYVRYKDVSYMEYKASGLGWARIKYLDVMFVRIIKSIKYLLSGSKL